MDPVFQQGFPNPNRTPVMNILFICNKSPYPAREGGPIAMNMMIEGVINAGHRVKVLAVNSNKYSVDITSIPEEYRKKTGIELVYIDLSIRPIPAFLNLFSSRSYIIRRFISKKFDSRLREILQSQQFDIVQFEMLHMSPYLETVRKYSQARIILRAHNVEYLLWERLAINCKNPLKTIYLRHIYRTLKKYEIPMLSKFDGIAAITENDAAIIRKCVDPGRAADIISIPFGIDLSGFPTPSQEPEFPSLFSIGSMDWNPNLEGVSWFLQNVWAEVNRRSPDLKFYIAGRHMPEWLMQSAIPGVVVVGEVENAVHFMHSKAIMVVPLLSGGGIRIKIIEGMAAGKAIISTPLGAEGIHCTDGKNIFLADTPEEFIAAILKVAGNRQLCTEAGKNARKLVEEEYQQHDLIRKMLGFYQKA
jgi:polysaccharide biosynthesis protein PslH